MKRTGITTFVLMALAMLLTVEASAQYGWQNPLLGRPTDCQYRPNYPPQYPTMQLPPTSFNYPPRPMVNCPHHSTLTHPPMALFRPAFMNNTPPTTINRPPTSINRPPTTINRPPTSINLPPTTINRPPVNVQRRIYR